MSAQLQGKRAATALGLMRQPGGGGNGVTRLAPSQRTSNSAASMLLQYCKKTYMMFKLPSLKIYSLWT